MSRPWEKIDFQRDWAGLVDRDQVLDYDGNFAQDNLNVDYFGGPVGKRLGSQYVNGWGSIALAGWTTTVGTVTDPSGFDPTDTLDFWFPDGSSETGFGITSIISGVITLSSAMTNAPLVGTVVKARRALGTNDRVDGLFQGNFRDASRRPIAAAGPDLFDLPALGAGLGGVAITTQFPKTDVAVATSTTNVTLDSTEGVEVGDKFVLFSGAGPTTRLPGGSNYFTVVTVTHATRVMTFTPAAASSPVIGDDVVFYPVRTAADTHFAQHANQTHIATATATPGDTPPIKYYQPDPTGAPATFRIQRHGIKAPTHSVLAAASAPAAATSGVGVLTGDYSYRVKYLNSITGQESEPGPEMTVTTAANDVALTDLPVSIDPQVDKKRVYRSFSLPSGESAGTWYFIEEILNSATTLTLGDDNRADSTLGTQMREFLDVPVPDEASVFTLWAQANRLVGINPENGSIIFSDQFDLELGFLKPEAWPSDNFFFINFDDGDKPRAVMAFYDSLLVLKERSVARVIGIPPDIRIEPVIFRQDLTGVGSFNQKAIVVDQNEMLFPAQDGVYLISRYEGVQQGFTSKRVSRPIDRGWSDIELPEATKTHAVFFRERRQLRMFIPTGGATEPDRSYVFQFEGNVQGQPYGWSRWTFDEAPDGGVQLTASAVLRGEPDVMWVGTATGDIIQMDVGAADRGGFAYTYNYETTLFAPAGKGVPARARALDLTAGVRASATLTVELDTDFQGPRASVVVALDQEDAFQLDVDKLDMDILGAVVAVSSAGIIWFGLGEYHRLRFREFSAVGQFDLQNWTFWYQELPEQARSRAIVQVR